MGANCEWMRRLFDEWSGNKQGSLTSLWTDSIDAIDAMDPMFGFTSAESVHGIHGEN